MPAPHDDCLTFIVTSEELALLKKLDFPCSEQVLATASPGPEGIELTGSRIALDSLAGWVAAEANYARRKRRSRQERLLDNIADGLESILFPIAPDL